MPLSNKLPAVGSVVMMTALKLLAGLSALSANPKSDAANVLLPSSIKVMLELVAVGASLTLATTVDFELAMLSTLLLPSV